MINNKNINFIKIVQEKAAKIQEASSWASFISNDVMFIIFLKLPIKSVLRFSCVCKSWYKLIHCAEFVEAYNANAVSVPILLRRVEKQNANTFYVERPNYWFVARHIHYLEIENEKGEFVDLNVSCPSSIVASCNGLLLITSRNSGVRFSSDRDYPLVSSEKSAGRLIVMNPMTRKTIGFPLGTLPWGFDGDSYGLVYNHSKGVFKVVHLFREKFGAIGCEILSLRTRSWKVVDGPNAALFTRLGQAPIAALGALHWCPGSPGLDYIISMGADDEKFFETNLPDTRGINDRLLEMGGFLSFVKCFDTDHIEVWVLKGLDGTEWVKQYNIQIDAILDDVNNVEYAVPSFALNTKEMVFWKKEKLYLYNFELEEIREIKMKLGDRIKEYENIISHSSNLATWEPLEPIS